MQVRDRAHVALQELMADSEDLSQPETLETIAFGMGPVEKDVLASIFRWLDACLSLMDLQD